MKTLVLTRTANSLKGTLGEIQGLNIFTLEPPWFSNLSGRSCIPAGRYQMWFGYSPRFNANRWHVTVPHRSGILIHTGNFLRDTEGCILVGKESLPDTDANENRIMASRAAYDELLKYLGETDKWELRVCGGE